MINHDNHHKSHGRLIDRLTDVWTDEQASPIYRIYRYDVEPIYIFADLSSVLTQNIMNVGSGIKF